MFSELFPEGQVAMVSGDGSAFSSLPFVHLVFTDRPKDQALARACTEQFLDCGLRQLRLKCSLRLPIYTGNKTSSPLPAGRMVGHSKLAISPVTLSRS